MPRTSAVTSPTQAQDATPPFACSWEMGPWGAAWVQVAGELDLTTSPQFRQTVRQAQGAAHLVVLDLRELSFTDSSGVHVILDADRHTQRQAGRLLIARGPAQVDRVLTLTGVCNLVAIFDLPPAGPVPALSHVLPPKVDAAPLTAHGRSEP